jgi:hypothetical protein
MAVMKENEKKKFSLKDLLSEIKQKDNITM